MKTTVKTLFAALATIALANCSGTANLSDLPVRDGPQTQTPFTLAAPAPVIANDA
jgi:uncharacterized protein YraI